MIENIDMDILKKILPVIVKKTGETAEKVYQQFKPKIANASHQYDENYRKRHGQLKVFCVGMREPISLDDVYVAVQFLEQENASKYRSPEDVERAFRERNQSHLILSSDERKDGTQVANEKQYLMLLGAPGIGKSTFLRKVGLEALKGEAGNFVHECIPVFLELKRFTEDQIDIEALIAQEFKICRYPYPEDMVKTALESGQLLILFDGLDEVPTANVDNVVGKIGDFVDQYSQNRFIASCRIAAYKGGFTQFTEVEMADFDDARIKAYINNWFESTSDLHRRQLDEEMKTAERCWEALNEEEHEATKELARNPLLLALLCLVYDNSQNFPRNRADLYEKALNIFLEEWAAEKRIRRDLSVSQYLDNSDEKRMLAEIAAKNFEVSRFLFNQNELIDQIKEFGERNANTPPTFNSSKILETIAVEQGLFVERVSRFYSFSHLTFQEYLTANYVVGDTRSIKGLVTKHLHDEQWREVFLLTAGLMREADNLLVEMEAEASKFINTPGLKALLRWAERITNTSESPYRGIAGRAFAIRQYFSLWLLNKIYEAVKDIGNRYTDRHRDFLENLPIYQQLYSHLHFDRDFYFDLDFCLDTYFYRNYPHNPNLYRDLEPYCHRARNLDIYLRIYHNLETYYHGFRPGFLVYQDFYQYMNANFYRLVPPKVADWFNKELSERITLTKRMEQARIFRRVNLQRIIRRFNQERKFINAARKGQSIKPPEKSIYDTWLSVLCINDNMLAISREEAENYIQYLRSVDLIVACKEAAGRVTPEIWQQIKDRLFTSDTGAIKD